MKKLYLGLGGLFLLFFLTIELQAQSAKKLYKDAEQFFKLKEYFKAEEALNQAVSLEKDNLDAWILLCKVNQQLNKPAEAVRSGEAALALSPEDLDALLALASAHESGKSFSKATEYYKTLVKKKPKSAEYAQLLAEAQWKSGDYSGMMQTAQQAFAYDNENDRFVYYQGVASDSLGNDLVAANFYRKAIELALASKSKREDGLVLGPYYTGLGTKEAELHQHANAIQTLTKAIQFAPANARLFLLRGISLSENSDLQSAIQDFGQAITLDSRFAEAYAQRAKVLVKLGQFPQAEADFNQVITLRPQDAAAFAGRALCLEKAGKLKDAVRDYKKAMQLAPGNGEYSKAFTVTREKYYEANKEEDKPSIRITAPLLKNESIVVKADTEELKLEGLITDASPLRSLVVNTLSLPVDEEALNPEFSTKVNIRTAKEIQINATDIYLNTEKLVIPIVRQESNPPKVEVTYPFEASNKTLFLPAANPTVIEGRILDESKIISVTAEGQSAVFSDAVLNPVFRFTLENFNGTSLAIKAVDEHGNTVEKELSIQRGKPDTSAMGNTWLIIVNNALQDGQPDTSVISTLKEAFASYSIQSILELNQPTKAELEQFFTRDLRQWTLRNEVKSILLWVQGEGHFELGVSYIIPKGGDKLKPESLFPMQNIRSSLETCTSVEHSLMLSASGPLGDAFASPLPETTNTGCAAPVKTPSPSAELLAPLSGEPKLSPTLFLQTLSYIASSNPEPCLSSSELLSKANFVFNRTKSANIALSRINGLKHEGGQFLLLKKR